MLKKCVGFSVVVWEILPLQKKLNDLGDRYDHAVLACSNDFWSVSNSIFQKSFLNLRS